MRVGIHMVPRVTGRQVLAIDPGLQFPHLLRETLGGGGVEVEEAEGAQGRPRRGGVVGLACGWSLAHRGADVTVLERDVIGEGASKGRNRSIPLLIATGRDAVPA